MLFCRKPVCVPLREPSCLLTQVVLRLRDKTACKKLAGCRCSSSKATSSCLVAFVGDGGGRVLGDTRAGSMEGGSAVDPGE